MFFFIEFICDFTNEERLVMEAKWCDANINLIKLMPSKKTRESADCVIIFISRACTAVLIFVGIFYVLSIVQAANLCAIFFIVMTKGYENRRDVKNKCSQKIDI